MSTPSGNIYDVLDPPGGAAPASAVAAPPAAPNRYDQLDPKKPPVTAADRVQAGEGGIIKGMAGLAGLIPDTIANAGDLALSGYDVVRHAFGTSYADLPKPWPVSPVATWLSKQADKSPITTTQPTRPDDTASRYLSAAGTAVPGALSGSSNPAQLVRGLIAGGAGASAGEAVDEAKPTGIQPIDTALSGLAQALTGAKVARAGQVRPGMRNNAVAAGQAEGYVFPPQTTNPGLVNQSLEGVAGKQDIQQASQTRNQPVSNTLARRAMGIDEHGGEISPNDIHQAKTQAAPGYDAIRTAGTLAVTPKLGADLDAAMARQSGAGNLAPSLRNTSIDKLVAQLKKNSAFDAGDAMDTIAEIRDRASSAFQSGDKSAGRAYRGISNALENAVEAGLNAKGAAGADMLAQFRASRQRFAMIANVEDARDIHTGNFVPGDLDPAAPLSGPLKVAADAAGQAPLAFKQPTHSTGVNHLGLWGSIAAGTFAGHEIAPGSHLAPIIGAAVPASRIAARSALLAKGLGQVRALKKDRVNNPAALVGTAASMDSRDGQPP